MDATSCAYVALSGLIGVGVEAVKRGELLRQKDCHTKAVCAMSEEEREEFGVQKGVVKRMPTSVEEAREVFMADKEVIDVLGDELVERYLSVNGVKLSYYPSLL
jgi:glutamine synthetase